jgi:hypothetical protein
MIYIPLGMYRGSVLGTVGIFRVNFILGFD